MPILGRCTSQVVGDEGVPPMLVFTVRLDHGRPVTSFPADTGAITAPTGEQVQGDSTMTIRLTQVRVGSGVDGYCWWASGAVDAPWIDGGVPAATSHVVDPLPLSAYQAVQQVQEKLGVHSGSVQAGVVAGQPIQVAQPAPAPRAPRAAQPNPGLRARLAAAAGAILIGAAVGLVVGLVTTPVASTAATVPTTPVTLAQPHGAGPPVLAQTLTDINLGGLAAGSGGPALPLLAIGGILLVVGGAATAALGAPRSIPMGGSDQPPAEER